MVAESTVVERRHLGRLSGSPLLPGEGVGGEGFRHSGDLAASMQRIHLTGTPCFRIREDVISNSVHWTRRVQRLCEVRLALRTPLNFQYDLNSLPDLRSNGVSSVSLDVAESGER